MGKLGVPLKLLVEVFGHFPVHVLGQWIQSHGLVQPKKPELDLLLLLGSLIVLLKSKNQFLSSAYRIAKEANSNHLDEHYK